MTKTISNILQLSTWHDLYSDGTARETVKLLFSLARKWNYGNPMTIERFVTWFLLTENRPQNNEETDEVIDIRMTPIRNALTKYLRRHDELIEEKTSVHATLKAQRDRLFHSACPLDN